MYVDKEGDLVYKDLGMFSNVFIGFAENGNIILQPKLRM